MGAGIAIAILLILIFGGSSLLSASASSSAASSQNPSESGGNESNSSEVWMPPTNDPSTWPGNESDPVWKCCHAMAYAEGYNVAGSNPNRLNNPGDISDGASTFGYEEHSGSKVTHFPDSVTGWNWLHDKVQNAVNGASDVYSPDMTWTEIAQKWAGNWQAWVTNVTRYMGVSPGDRFGDAFGV